MAVLVALLAASAQAEEWVDTTEYDDDGEVKAVFQVFETTHGAELNIV